MLEKKSSASLRWFTFFALALAALPLALSWRAAGVLQVSQETVRDWSRPGEPPREWERPNEIAIQLRPGAQTADLADLGRRFGVNLAWNSLLGERQGMARLTVPAGSDPSKLLEALLKDSRVEAADVIHLYATPIEPQTAPHPPQEGETPDRRGWKPNDPRYKEQWNFQMIKMEEAWAKAHGKGAIVAVIDTGVAFKDTPKGKIARDFKETSFVKGYDLVNRNDTPYDDQGHGTHVAGTIAESTDNKEGVTGIAFEATIMPIKVLNADGSGTSADIGEGIRWAADHGAHIINMSLGGPFPDSVMRSACEYARKKGVTIICAAGNSGREGVGYPAAFADCIAVSSVGPKGELSFYSSWGKQVAIAAPGGDKEVGGEAGGILQNTVRPNSDGSLTDDYYSFQGTSMASPHVAGVAALIVSQGVKDPKDVKAILQKSAQKKGPANKYGAGVLDASGAVSLAATQYGDGITRFWIVALLFVGCYAIGKTRQRAGSDKGYPFWGTSALAFGLLFPDWLTGYLGMTSPLNLVGHSVLVPAVLILMGAEGKTERRMLGWMAFGMSMHLGWEFLRGTAPFGYEIGFWQLTPWVCVNVLTGLGMLIGGLEASKD